MFIQGASFATIGSLVLAPLMAMPAHSQPLAESQAKPEQFSVASADHIQTPRMQRSKRPRIRQLSIKNGWSTVDVGLPTLVEDVAEVTYPANAKGRLKGANHGVVLFLHGQHIWCYQDDSRTEPTPEWCAGTGNTPVPSYLGYRYLAKKLARQGKIVISISADGINAQSSENVWTEMSARASLVEYHLHALQRADRRKSPGYGKKLRGGIDLSSVILMGHSRGGEGVVRAAQLINQSAESTIDIAGVVPFAPVNNNQGALGSIPTVTLLPACDGDVSNQVGQTYVDRSRDLYGRRDLQGSVWIPKANHNYFNTEWTPGSSVSGTGSDDADEIYDNSKASGSCKTHKRLKPAKQRAIGRAYLSSAVKYMQDADQSQLAFLDGSGPRPGEVTKRRVATRSASLGGPDQVLLIPNSRTQLKERNLSTILCAGSALMGGIQGEQSRVCASGIVEADEDTAWLGPSSWSLPGLPNRTAVKVSWSKKGIGLAKLNKRANLARKQRISARVVVGPSTRGKIKLAVRDASGRTRTIRTRGRALRPITRGSLANRLWPQSVWISNNDLRRKGMNLRRITHVGLSTKGKGNAWIVDLSSRRATKRSNTTMLPSASVREQSFVVTAGERGLVKAQISLDGPAPRGAKIKVQVAGNDGIVEQIDRTFKVSPGSRFLTVPISVDMPLNAGPDDVTNAQISIYTLSRVNVGNATAMLHIKPRGAVIRQAAVVKPQVSASPGGKLKWDFTVSQDEGSGTIAIQAKSLSGNLTWSDLDQTWLADHLDPGVPLPTGSIGDGLPLSATRVSSGKWQILLPLSTKARAGDSLKLQIVRVEGAYYPNRGNLRGTVTTAPSP